MFQTAQYYDRVDLPEVETKRAYQLLHKIGEPKRPANLILRNIIVHRINDKSKISSTASKYEVDQRFWSRHLCFGKFQTKQCLVKLLIKMRKTFRNTIFDSHGGLMHETNSSNWRFEVRRTRGFAKM